MKKGDIVLVPFPFTDLSGSKNRPALVLVVNTLDITVSFISTQLQWQEPTDLLLKPTINNGLKKDSLVRITKLATLSKALILGRLGSIESNEIQDLDKKLMTVFNIQTI
ncbi:MAG: type II toxin-antitoxin system PemK/MazF family toxin [Saprospiraceae bacterium]